MTSGKQLETIVYPQTNHTIVYLFFSLEGILNISENFKMSIMENKK